MPKGKPGSGVKTKAAVKPCARARATCHRGGSVRPPKHAARRETSQPFCRHAACRRGRAAGTRTRRRARAMTVLAARADIDPLTDMFNRRAFERELARSLAYVKRHGTSAALIYLDLDGFKAVNDRHGHAAGDAVLQGGGERARAAMCAPPTWWRGSAATNSRCCCGTATRRKRITKARALEEAIGRTTATHEGRGAHGRRFRRRGAAAAARPSRPIRSSAPTAPCMRARRASAASSRRERQRRGIYRPRHNVPHSPQARDRLSEGQCFPFDGGFRC